MDLRGLVSKKKLRFQEDGFDLDLTYITDRVIAMGAPSLGSEAVYRNPLSEVQRFFETRHAGKYRIYDLRGEKGAAYDPALFKGRVMEARFFDHNPAPLALIKAVCEDVSAWLAADKENVVALHWRVGTAGGSLSAWSVAGRRRGGASPGSTSSSTLPRLPPPWNGFGLTASHYVSRAPSLVWCSKAGKGRTGLMVAAYLVHSKLAGACTLL